MRKKWKSCPLPDCLQDNNYCSFNLKKYCYHVVTVEWIFITYINCKNAKDFTTRQLFF